MNWMSGLAATTILLVACQNANEGESVTTTGATQPTSEQEVAMTPDKLGSLARTFGASTLTEKASHQCDIYVSFGSYCCGPDSAVLKALVDYIEDSDDVSVATMQSWGREGERDFCIAATSPSKIQSVKSDLKSILEQNKTDRGPVTIR